MLILSVAKQIAKLSVGRNSAVSSLWAAHAAAVRRQRTYVALSALDDRALRDVGLNRSMVMSVAAASRSTQWPEPTRAYQGGNLEPRSGQDSRNSQEPGQEFSKTGTWAWPSKSLRTRRVAR